jgi:hypothetical protein
MRRNAGVAWRLSMERRQVAYARIRFSAGIAEQIDADGPKHAVTPLVYLAGTVMAKPPNKRL